MIPRILDMLFLSAPHLAGDDVRQRSEERRRYRFYPRHPRGWRRALFASLIGWVVFLSTPPSRVATARPRVWPWPASVSIHATLAGGDRSYFRALRRCFTFLSTPPSRVATPVEHLDTEAFYVSIHATLAGGDIFLQSMSFGSRMFLSTPPSRVATLCARSVPRCTPGFYPRHPRGWRRAGQ